MSQFDDVNSLRKPPLGSVSVERRHEMAEDHRFAYHSASDCACGAGVCVQERSESSHGLVYPLRFRKCQ